jgi:hypothetical protein
VVNKINRDVNAALTQTSIKARLFAQGMQLGAGNNSPEAFKRVMQSDAKLWGELITQLNIKLD